MKIHTACVYCGSSNQADTIYKQAARELGEKLASNDLRLVYGGGRMGLMGIVANSCVEAGGYVIGYIPQHLESYEGANRDIQELHVVDSMHTRKALMAQESDAFVILPGGFGTLDELFEIITWRQLDLHTKPIILLNIQGYWDPLISLFQRVVEENFADAEDINYIKIVKSVDEVIEFMKCLECEGHTLDAKVI